MIPAEPLCIFSKDGRGHDGRGEHRYTLWRRDLNEALPGLRRPPLDDWFIQFICLNPSDATETENDLTVGRCTKWARKWGFGAFLMTNLFAYRTPHPITMMGAADPIGPENDQHIVRLAKIAHTVVIGWGRGGDYRNRAATILAALRIAKVQPMCLGRTKDGFPIHPLARGKHRIPDDVQLQPFYPYHQ